MERATGEKDSESRPIPARVRGCEDEDNRSLACRRDKQHALAARNKQASPQDPNQSCEGQGGESHSLSGRGKEPCQ